MSIPSSKKIMVRPLLASYVIITQLWFISYIIWFDYGLASGPRGGGGGENENRDVQINFIVTSPPQTKNLHTIFANASYSNSCNS
jgi:hypothetical protein